jgi:hypothetical protein
MFSLLCFSLFFMLNLRCSSKADIVVEFAEFEQGYDVIPGRSTADKAELLLHYRRQIVGIKGYDLSTLEAKNVDTRDIYCLARGSYSFRTNGQLTFMRPPNSELDHDNVLRDVDAQ